ncbi:MAG: hypothetical protein BAJALOKI3v1_140003 [Promethearchaeota archaeon]|nr:MAG: hypothetical protein BAJALOKI3v1_140003 [Candidatus Lokiarchaeota archaeon]
MSITLDREDSLIIKVFLMIRKLIMNLKQGNTEKSIKITHTINK